MPEEQRSRMTTATARFDTIARFVHVCLSPVLQVLLLAAAASPASGQVFFEQFAVGGDGFFNDDGPGSTPNQVIADNFSIDGGATIRTVEFSGFYIGVNPLLQVDDFTISFFEWFGGSPGDLIFAENVGGLQRQGDGLFSYSAELSSAFLAVDGQDYVISIRNNSTEGQWAWSRGMGGDSDTQLLTSSNSGASWNIINRDAAFRLTGVPEPMTLRPLALGLGLGTLALRRKR